MDHAALIDEYLAGPQQLRNAIAGMTDELIDAAPVPGKWSTRQVICHIADFEPVYADRIKRALAEEEPTIFGGDPDAFAARLAYDQRDIEYELQMIESVRKHVASILRTLKPGDFQRRVMHSEAGPLTLEQLLVNITKHIPHHVEFIKEKREAL
ncbi:MAG: DinB family protein [Pirellulaceae bacterium]